MQPIAHRPSIHGSARPTSAAPPSRRRCLRSAPTARSSCSIPTRRRRTRRSSRPRRAVRTVPSPSSTRQRRAALPAAAQIATSLQGIRLHGTRTLRVFADQPSRPQARASQRRARRGVDHAEHRALPLRQARHGDDADDGAAQARRAQLCLARLRRARRHLAHHGDPGAAGLSARRPRSIPRSVRALSARSSRRATGWAGNGWRTARTTPCCSPACRRMPSADHRRRAGHDRASTPASARAAGSARR